MKLAMACHTKIIQRIKFCTEVLTILQNGVKSNGSTFVFNTNGANVKIILLNDFGKLAKKETTAAYFAPFKRQKLTKKINFNTGFLNFNAFHESGKIHLQKIIVIWVSHSLGLLENLCPSQCCEFSKFSDAMPIPRYAMLNGNIFLDFEKTV